MKIFDTLNHNLLKQPFGDTQSLQDLPNKYKQLADVYSKIENSIAVLSDLKSNKSYVYYGGIATQLGIGEKNNSKEISSIWEDDILDKIHPDDLLGKHMLELQFFHFIKKLEVKKQADFHVISRMRIKNKFGKYIPIQHRMFYVCSATNGDPWLGLCLYNYSYDKSEAGIYEGAIVNSATGNVIESDRNKCNNILSKREKEVLSLIRKGKMSREIADLLSVSKHTIDRHRQNILEKLCVGNSIEACRIAELMNM